MQISERVSELPKTRIGEIHDLVSRKKNIINFGPGWPDFDMSENLRAHAAMLLRKKGIAQYGSIEGLPALREAICKKLKKENKINAKSGNILVTVGSTEGILLSLMCTCDAGEEVLVTNPSYFAYELASELLTCNTIKVPIYEKDKWQPNYEGIKKVATSRAQAIILNTPANPTGSMLSKKSLEEIADILIEKNLIAIVDEAYEKFVYNRKHISLASLNGLEKKVITLQTFSKSTALPGFRIGYMVAPEEIIKTAMHVKTATTLCAPTISQYLAIAALEEKAFTKKMVSEYKKRRGLMYSRIKELGLSCAKPEGAFYIFANIKPFRMSSFEFVKFLIENGVATVPGSDFGSEGEGYVRFSFSCSLEDINNGMDRVETALKKLKRKT